MIDLYTQQTNITKIVEADKSEFSKGIILHEHPEVEILKHDGYECKYPTESQIEIKKSMGQEIGCMMFVKKAYGDFFEMKIYDVIKKEIAYTKITTEKKISDAICNLSKLVESSYQNKYILDKAH